MLPLQSEVQKTMRRQKMVHKFGEQNPPVLGMGSIDKILISNVVKKQLTFEEGCSGILHAKNQIFFRFSKNEFLVKMKTCDPQIIWI